MVDHQSYALGIKLLALVVLAKKGPANFDFTAIGVESAVSGGTHQQAGGFINEAKSTATSLRSIEVRPGFRFLVAILCEVLFPDAWIARQRALIKTLI